MSSMPTLITNPYKLVVVSLRSVDTGERGYFIGEPMLAMVTDAQGRSPMMAMSVDETTITVDGITPIGVMMDNLRKLIGMV